MLWGIEDNARLHSETQAVPAKRLEEETSGLLRMEHDRMVGQDEAIVTASQGVRRARLNDPGRPIGSFIFLGPVNDVEALALSNPDRSVRRAKNEVDGDDA